MVELTRVVPVLGLSLLLGLGMLAFTVPVPPLDAYLAGQVTARVAAQMACPGTGGPQPDVSIGGDRLLPQVLRRRVSDLRLSVPEMAVGTVRKAAFAASLRDVSQPEPDVTRVGSMNASITIRFADLPVAKDEPPATFARAEDGSLTVTTESSGTSAANVRAKLYLRTELRGDAVAAVPQSLQLFGRTIKADDVTELTGGTRVQKLPDLPEGLSYRSITPRADGLHVALSGTATEALTDLPRSVDGRQVTYRERNGELGISTTVDVPAFGEVPLTIFTAPRLRGSTLTLVPQSVEVLDEDRPPSDFLARLVLRQVSPESLRRTLPTLPSGVEYRSVGVDRTGVRVAVSGVTVKPFSELSSGDGRPTTFGAEKGMLTATTKGGSPSGSATPVVLYARPRITGNTLDIAPQQIRMFGIRFPADTVLEQVGGRDTTYPLPELPTNLRYEKAEVTSTGLRITMSGLGVTLRKGQLTTGSC